MESSSPHKPTIIKPKNHIYIQSPPENNAQSRCGGLSTSRGLIAILGGGNQHGFGKKKNCMPTIVTALEESVSLHATVGQRL